MISYFIIEIRFDYLFFSLQLFFFPYKIYRDTGSDKLLNMYELRLNMYDVESYVISLSFQHWLVGTLH